jgi:cobalt/nickel transport system permease protein
LVVVAAAVMIVSTPANELVRFLAYAGLILLLWGFSGVSGWQLLRRSMVALPVLFLAAGMLLLRGSGYQDAIPAAISIVAKGWCAAWLLALLGATTSTAELTWALRKLGVPDAFGMILALMGRYTILFSEEYNRMARARESRTARPLGRWFWAIHSRQFGTLLLRALDRAERIHSAMAARGFEGRWPVRRTYSLGLRDVTFAVLAAAGFSAARMLS